MERNTTLVKAVSEKNAAQQSAPVSYRMNWSRYELKYRVSPGLAAQVMDYMRPYMHLDRFSAARDDGFYPIVSLYLDSQGLALYRATVDGRKNRFKLRIRGYSDDRLRPCFFEIKRRMNNIIIKSRAHVREDQVAGALAGSIEPPFRASGELKAFEQFKAYQNFVHAVPLVRVRYLRKAFEALRDANVRVTFDKDIAYSITKTPDTGLNTGRWLNYKLNHYVMEIKFTNAYPAWVGQMIKHLNLQRGSMSKYTRCLETAAAQGLFTIPKSGGMDIESALANTRRNEPDNLIYA